MIKFFRQIRQRLLAENKVSRYLLYAIGEIILVVIGILLALQINTWNEARKSLQDEALYLSRLLSENRQDINSFSMAISELEKGNNTIENLSASLKNSDIKDSLLVQYASDYFKFGSIFPIFSSSSSTFEDLSSTGNLKVITNVALRDDIVQHYAKHKQVEERIQIAIDWALPLDAPFTFDNNIMKFEPSTAFLFPDEPIKVLARELRDKKITYISNAAAHYWINKDAISQIRQLLEETSLLVTKLENELNK